MLSLIPLIFHGRFYFQDDTENGAYGVWYHLGESLLQGKVPVLNPSVWSSGNYIAEGQWGTWNPLVMLFGLLAYVSPNAVVLTTVLKVAMLVLAGVGTFVLARSYTLSPEWAFIAGIAVPLNGFTMYFDAPSWVTGALVWAIFPFFWAQLRQLMLGKRNPFWAFVTGYLIVTVGYVAGTVAIGFILLAVGIETLIRKAWWPAARIALTGVSIGLVAVVVFLPGVLTAAVTTRGTTGIWNDDYMSIDFTSLLLAPIATAYPPAPFLVVVRNRSNEPGRLYCVVPARHCVRELDSVQEAFIRSAGPFLLPRSVRGVCLASNDDRPLAVSRSLYALCGVGRCSPGRRCTSPFQAVFDQSRLAFLCTRPCSAWFLPRLVPGPVALFHYHVVCCLDRRWPGVYALAVESPRGR